MTQNIGRFFFAFSIVAPWDEKEPEGRMISPSMRHMTTHFIGNVERSRVEAVLPQITIDPFYFTGILSELIFLPTHFPKNVSAVISVETGRDELKNLYKEVGTHLQSHKLTEPPKHPYLPHTSFCRAPYDKRAWKRKFHHMPCYSPTFACYESIGDLKYEMYKSWPLLMPFDVMDHPADIAYRVHGRTPTEIFYHACMAIAFFFPPFSSYIPQEVPEMHHLDQIIDNINQLIAKIDGTTGCPVKAVSRHGEIKNNYWEMIVDV